MTKNHSLIFEENLSENFLSEGAITKKIKISERININMKMSSFKISNLQKVISDDKVQALPFCGTKSRFYEKTGGDKKFANSFKAKESHSFRNISEDIGNQACAKRVSIKSEISFLLKKSAELRETRKLIMKKKQSLMNVPIEGLEILNINCDQKDFVTFGA
ncbi:unnamed protein product [Moneuplotes crassus]|uniref:Uncharacterized protein n=1 Tax=Euplotes crassus TaxID=5936 RepID=A0AAD1UDV2_EUPCR|nr:unnamed protein product [Moneuplotes crassus]